ncbi:acyl carrier protein [Microbispora sp. NEAU-D428]|uniref:acyl carrier protein n=1 Tax=Microbispora sitophila TaxID=2771537 RepID=UPI00186823D4|nr:acyl carrier protein [Microbispora sitophila]MBE3008773.1 acyl carrier protein [Microbispora sitophila]
MTNPTLTRETIDQFVFDAMTKLGVEPSEITVDASFDDLGLDSLDVTELGQSVKREYGVDLSPRDLEDALLVREALAVIYAKAGL